VNRLVIVARLQPDAHEDADALLRKGPPFDPEEIGLQRHAAYLTANEVVFVFEAPEVEWIVNGIVDDPILSEAFAPWRRLIEEPPRLARERYYWTLAETKSGIGLGF